ncbi:hypothetical protein A9Z42_0034680 [Trichoderma parareesei]|uniref:Uncharacterized protein n=1 Tax=Trichoderma parareesei TaxID=858221 RepID=A0A2H2ZUU1_TRIPA|nr:hypothetical protein A9Z42_0034680 [Trichoderma parareesei]
MVDYNKIYLHFLLVACLATPVTASWWDDFTNNLATDLTPLIALFGEQATKQFLSESTTILDNFIFAMAPLGILTGVVSAIRVCGGPSLRAFIGRAQEGGGIAEAELCSSTSRDVCELYHNGAIVRVFGRPKILEIVYDPVLEANESGDKREFGINISRDYYQKSIRNDTRWQEKGQSHFDNEAKSTSSFTIDAFDNFAPNPNLSLNIGIVKRSSFVYAMAALFGFLAQSSVIVLAGIVQYKLKWQKNESTIDPWAFPFILAGTICVCYGMYLCAALVNDSTKERVFERKADQKASPSPMLYVVQPGNQVVGDQTFDPFLTSKSTSSYITSWKSPTSSSSSSGSQVSTTSRSWRVFYQSLKRPSEEISVLIATSITTLGFAFQFVGLRAMHSIVSLLQLAVTIIMSIIRALLRTQRLSTDANVLRDRPDEVSSHELDWLALQIGKGPDEPRCFWRIVSKVPAQATELPSERLGNKTFEYRLRLAELTGQSANADSKLSNAWGDDLVSGRLQAQQLRKAIEESISIFIAHAKEKADFGSMKSIPWPIHVAMGKLGNMPRQVPTYQHMDIPLRAEDTVWTVDQNLLEAIIGLWSWSIVSDPLTEGEAFGFKTSTASDIPIYRIVAAGTESKVQQAWAELQIWSEGYNMILSSLAMKTLSSSDPDTTGTNAATIWKDWNGGQLTAVDGGDSSETGVLFGKSDPYQRLFGWHGIDNTDCATVGAIRIKSNHIPTLCAQDIYQSFLCTIAAYFELEKSTTTVTREENTMRLEHRLITKLTDCFEASGLGSKQDAFLVIIPALQSNRLLPRAVEAVPTAYRTAVDLRKSNGFREAERVLRWVWGVVSGSGEPLDTVMIELGELYRYALCSEKWSAFGRQGIAWMGMQRGSGLSDSANEAIARYVALEKRPRESRTAQQVLDAVLRRDREAALWSISNIGKETQFPVEEKSGRSVLSYVCQEGWFELVRAVLEIGSVVEAVDNHGRTALSYAAEQGHVSIVTMLMEANASPAIEDTSRRSPLSYAAGQGHVAVIEKVLTDRRASIYSEDEQHRSPLHHAAINGRHDAIECLVNRGARIDALDNNFHSPLIAALSNTRRRKADRWQTAELLVKLKAQVNLIIEGKEAWEWALINGEFMCAEFLLEHHTAQEAMGAVVYVTEGWRDLVEFSDSKSQSGFRIRFLGDDSKERQVTMEDVMLLAQHGCHITIHYVLDGKRERKIDCGKAYKMISTLLDSLSNVDAIERLLEAAALNHSDGEAITTILLDHWYTRNRTPIQITDRLAEALSQNLQGSGILTRLLQLEETIHVTEAAAPIICQKFDVEVTKLLISRLEGHIQITLEFLGSLFAHSEHIEFLLEMLLCHSKAEVRIPEEAACMIAECLSENAMAILLSRHGKIVAVTDSFVNAAAANGYGAKVLAVLLNQRQLQVKITEATLVRAAKNWNGQEVVEMLLDRRGAQVQITEDIVEAAASHPGGPGLMELLLDRRGDEFQITDKVVQLAAANHKGHALLRLLFDRRGEEVRVTEEVLTAAAGNDDCAVEIIQLLLKKRPAEVQSTEGVLKAAAENRKYADKILGLFLEERGEQVHLTEEVLKAAAGSGYVSAPVLERLLDQHGDQLEITEEVVKAAVANRTNPLKVLRLLHRRHRHNIPITEEVLKTSARNPHYAVGLLDKIARMDRDHIRITEEVVLVAASNESQAQGIFRLLLDKLKLRSRVLITEEVVKAIIDNVGNTYSSAWKQKELMELLLDRRCKFQATENMVEHIPAEWTDIRQRISELIEQHQNREAHS